MHGGLLQEQAEKALMGAVPKDFLSEGCRLEVLAQDGTLVLFLGQGQAEEDPILLLKANAGTWNGFPGPYVIDPETGVLARRCAIPYRIWTRPETLRRAIVGEDFHDSLPVISSLRLWKRIGGEVTAYRYGRSRRLTLYLQTKPPLLAARVFPEGLLLMPGSSLSITDGLIHSLALVLLARSGVATRPYPFHRLQEEHFFHVERAVCIPPNIGRETMKTLENELIRAADEDCEIIHALLSSGILCGGFLYGQSNYKDWRSGNEREHE
jgi:hypothetical protein